jgi:hypothetical protein
MGRLTAQGKAFASHAEVAYEDHCTIRRRVVTKDSGGGNLPRDQIIASNVPCRIKPSSVGEKQLAGATQSATAYTVRVPRLHLGQSLRIDSTCFLDIAARDEVEAQTLSVVAPLPHTGYVDAVAVRQS